MNARVLFVDDEPNILAAFKRQLFKQFEVDTAVGGHEGLAAIAERGPYAVAVADMRMPGMDGIQFLSRVRDLAPDTVRMMLTGHSDLQTAIDAINQGNIFRFLTKPCPKDMLIKAVSAGVEQHRLVTAEKELLEKTLRRSVTVLTDVLSIVNPTAFGRASRVRRTVSDLALELDVDKPWEMEVAAMLSQLGCVTVPEEVLSKVYGGELLAPHEAEMFEAHPRAGRDLIGGIPRLENAAEIIAYQERLFDGSDGATGAGKGKAIPLGARILKVALDFDTLVSSGRTSTEAYAIMQTRPGWYDKSVLDALAHLVDLEGTQEVRFVKVEELAQDMILADDVKTASGTLLIAKGQEMTPSIKLRLVNNKRTRGLREPIKVSVQTKGRRPTSVTSSSSS
jgi:response regulator RpfG family c-di-GMP phosphodiesterase